MDSASRMRNFTEIFIDLTKTYKTSKAYFPEDFIINLLFETAITNHFNSDWLSDVVWKAGLSVTKLFRLLQQIYRSKVKKFDSDLKNHELQIFFFNQWNFNFNSEAKLFVL